MTPDADPPWKARWRGIRRLEVLRAASVTPLMRRITMGGPEFAGLHGGPNLKLILPPRPGAELELPPRAPDGKALWAEGERRPVVRTYTVSRIDAAAGELDVDFVLHGDHGEEGVASGWARRARPGDPIGAAALGGRTVRPAARYIIAGDHTALPGIANILAALPDTARGEAFIEVPGAEEEWPLRRPPGVAVTWLHHGPEGAGRTDGLARAVQALDVAPGEDVFGWVGCESIAARAIRVHLRDVWRLDRRQMLVIGYWKLGMSETEYGQRLDHDRDEDYHATAREEEAQAHAPAQDDHPHPHRHVPAQ
ncbi:siderophore-interacting protein [Muricoccus radiodurans]|uniref:siderophore-interacting protein n=1 Tax=Muricoccus radiodurans TaxID=2231721 RepID=UPI003CF9FF2B